MGIFKMLGGAALGVAAIAAAPVTGGGSVLAAASLATSLAGAGTVAAAVGAGTAGAVAGALLDEEHKNKINDAYVEGKNEGKKEESARNALKIAKLEKKLEQAKSSFASTKKTQEFYTGLFAIGIAIANCDGEISKEELRDIKEFSCGAAAQQMPNLVDTIDILVKNPPSFEESLSYVREYIPVNQYHIITDLLEIVALADGKKDGREAMFIRDWKKQISN